jgi:xanthine dehydrogenase YagR molybdenum-binding subunit
MASEPSNSASPTVVGRSFVRVDGALKVSGAARYSSDRKLPGMLYGVPVCATVGNGHIDAIDSAAAEAMPGVRKIYTRANIGKFYRVADGSGAKIDESRPPLEDDVIRYYGQYVALVVADTFEHATAAADAVKVNYKAVQAPKVATRLSADDTPKPDTERGDPERAYASAAVKVDHTYSTPTETHNPIELHASVAIFDGTHFTLYETSQAVVNHRNVMAQMLGVPIENVRVITEFLGSGFGGKLWPWTHALLAAAAARDLRAPIKLVVSRQMMFHNVGHRPRTQQRVRLGAGPDGKLVSLRHDYIYDRALQSTYKEYCGEGTGFMYSTPNLRATAAYTERNMGPATSMRGPGAIPGMYAIESAMDELAIQLKMDPVELRLRNEPSIDESLGVPFSSRHLKECLTTGAEKFGWVKRNPTIGSMQHDGKVVGWGMAACTWLAERFPAQASVMFNADGTVRVASGTQDIGTGTYTVLGQMAAELTGVDLARVKVVIGDTNLPPGPTSGGSMATGSLVPAVAQAARAAIVKLLATASAHDPHFARIAVEQLAFSNGRVHRKGELPDSGRRFEDVLASARISYAEGRGNVEGTFGRQGKPEYSSHSFGAHFVEVTWQPEIARLRVNRTVTVIDAGRIINPLTGRNQIEGAVVMGVGMALLEETEYEPHSGKAINSNLADYMMTTHADSPEMDVIFLDYPDYKLNEMGARGIGEIGLAGVAAAITAAVHHATGVRVRNLPVRVENLLA